MACDSLSIAVGPKLATMLELIFRARKGAFLIGPHGIGKSQMFKHLSSRLGLSEPIIRDLSIMEPTDLVGLPRFVEGVTRFAFPSWLPTSGAGILVLEELTRAPVHMQAPVFQLMTERRLNDYILPDGWAVMASMNPADAEYHVREMDPALLARFCIIQVCADPENWLEWARGNGIHDSIIALVNQNPDIFEEGGTNPRSLTYASDLLLAAEAAGTRDYQVLSAVIAGFIGRKFARELLGEEPGNGPRLSPKQILTNFKALRTTLVSWNREKRLDLLEAMANDITLFINRNFCGEYSALPKDMRKNFDALSQVLPKDLSMRLNQSCSR